MLAFDHIVVAAPDLASGAAHVADSTGLTMKPGGAHPLMGTHNRLLRLGYDEFLEVIALDPEATPPTRTRWFGLDHPVTSPRLAHWVLRVADIDHIPADWRQINGPAIGVTRGDLSWRISVPNDGALPMQGMFPSIVDWDHDPIPPRAMAGSDIAAGAGLVGLSVSHPQADQIAERLGPYLDDPRIDFTQGAPGLRARIAVGGRVVTLS